MPPNSQAADRNLLFGIVALQMDFITRDQLIAAMAAWVVEKHKPLGQILCEQEALSPEDHEAIESLVRRHLLRHDNDAERSLAALSSIGRRLRDDLGRISDPEVQASLPCVGAARGDAELTLSYVGSPTTPGGRFRILRPHAQGGLGVVSVALDEELHREVALKEIQEQYASEEQPRLRFLLEAEITGGLEHPGIVPVYGLGHHPDGRPFYAMRFVRGESFREAVGRFHGGPDRQSAGSEGEPGRVSTGSISKPRGAQATPLAFRRLLSRFLDVCNAIAYAHSRGVLHRDIKPGNILLGPYGETLVVDWGLAKVTGRDNPGTSEPSVEGTLRPPSASGTAETQPGSALGTPAYMSPEQAEGRLDLLGSRSDVYSLGATLYVLLTGRPPFDGDVAEVLRSVQRGEFVTPRSVNPSIPKPLEAICHKAMALKQADRYETPRALAEDIEHWLADEPVSAYPEPWPDRARRWSRRHRTLVTSATAVLVLAVLSSVGFAAVVTGKNRELARQTQRAESREKMAIDAVKRFRDVVVEELVLQTNPALQELRKKLLKEPLAFFKSLRAQLQGDRDTRPEALSRLAVAAFELGKLAHEIGDRQDALGSHRESLAIRELLAHDNPKVTGFQSDLAESHNAIGLLAHEIGQPDQALESYGKSIAILERLAREDPSVTGFQSDLATGHNNIGALQSETGHPDLALQSYGKALAIREQLAGESPSVTAFQDHLAASHNNIGALQRETGHSDQALVSCGKALAIWERLAREYPSVTKFQSNLAAGHNSIGAIQSDTGHPALALESCGKALAIWERLAGENPSVTNFQSSLATSQQNIGNIQRLTGNPEQALESYRKVLTIWERLAQENPSVTEFQNRLAGSYTTFGLRQSATGQSDHALESLAKALAIRERLARENPSVTQFQSDLAASHHNIGIIEASTGHPDRAAQPYIKALAIWERLVREHPESPDHASKLGGMLNDMAMIDLDAKRFQQARDRLQRAISWQNKALAAYPRHLTYRQFLGNHLRNLTKAAKALGNDDEARAAERELDELGADDPAKDALDHRLAAVIRGEAPKDNRERLQLAYRAYEKKLYAASMRLFGAALDADPKLADDPSNSHRYDAACAAALAASRKTTPTLPSPIKGEGKRPKSSPRVGEDTGSAANAQLTDADRAKHRKQARTWLDAELAIWTKLLASANAQQRRAIVDTLKHWKQDADLAGVRDETALAELPAIECEGWKVLWARVDALLNKASRP
jgi:serine/threonine-protein kinase